MAEETDRLNTLYDSAEFTTGQGGSPEILPTEIELGDLIGRGVVFLFFLWKKMFQFIDGEFLIANIESADELGVLLLGKRTMQKKTGEK